MSINGEKDEYHIEAENRLSAWLKKSRYEVYKVPDDFVENTHPETLMQNINGKRQPYTNLSCFYNDLMCFEMICLYEFDTDTSYEIIAKIRPDIYFNDIRMLQFVTDSPDSLILHSCIPPCEIYIYGWRSIPRCISDAFAYGNKKTMKLYCNTYNYILLENSARNGNYRINYEPCVTENIIDFCILDSTDSDYIRDKMINNKNGVAIEYFTCPYVLDRNRRTRDVIQNTAYF